MILTGNQSQISYVCSSLWACSLNFVIMFYILYLLFLCFPHFFSYIYFYFHLNRQGKTEAESKPIAYIQFFPRWWEEGAYKKAQFTFVIMRPNSSSDSSLLHTGSDAVSTT